MMDDPDIIATKFKLSHVRLSSFPTIRPPLAHRSPTTLPPACRPPRGMALRLNFFYLLIVAALLPKPQMRYLPSFPLCLSVPSSPSSYSPTHPAPVLLQAPVCVPLGYGSIPLPCKFTASDEILGNKYLKIKLLPQHSRYQAHLKFFKIKTHSC